MADNLRSESMPPEGEPRPDPAELETLDAWLDAALEPDGHEPGRITLRRLNRSEYNNTIRDLIGLDLRPADDFPSDDVGYGFDNIGEVLATPPILVEMYLAAADSVIGEAFGHPEVKERILNPPADVVPLAFRRYKPPVRAPAVTKHSGTARAADDPRAREGTAYLRHPARVRRPRLASARDSRRADAAVRDRRVGGEGRRDSRLGHSTGAAGRAGVAAISLPARTGSRRRFVDRAATGQRFRPGRAALVLPLEQHAR